MTDERLSRISCIDVAIFIYGTWDYLKLLTSKFSFGYVAKDVRKRQNIE